MSSPTLRPNSGKREPTLDLVRILSVVCVVSSHFYLNNGFYSHSVAGVRMLVMVIHRASVQMCIPIFIFLTGYLGGGKRLSKGCYAGLKKQLSVYLLACMAGIVYRLLSHEELSLAKAVFGILDFSIIRYAWYVEMYIGLALLSPFLNVLYQGLGSKSDKRKLLAVLLILTAAPGITNSYDFFTEGWLRSPSISSTYQKLLPSYWVGFYPVTCYFIGCYLREYPPRMKKRYPLCVYCVCLVTLGLYNYYRCYGSVWSGSGYMEWGSLPNIILAVSAFVFFLNIPAEQFSPWLARLLEKLSGLCFGAYLSSGIFDSIFYPRLNEAVPDMPLRLNWYFLIVPASLILSFALSSVLNLVQRWLSAGVRALRNEYASWN